MALDPSIALQVKPLQLPDPLEGYTRALTLQNLSMQNQQHQRQYDQDLATEEVMRATGGDLSKAVPLLTQRGLYKPAMALQSQLAAQQKAALERRKLEGDIAGQDEHGALKVALTALSNPDDATIGGIVDRYKSVPGVEQVGRQLLSVPPDKRQPIIMRMILGMKGGPEALKALSPNLQSLGGVSRDTNIASLTYGKDIQHAPAPDSIVTRDATGRLVPNEPVVNVKERLAIAGKPSVDNRVTIAGETEESKDIGKWRAKTYTDVQDAGRAAFGKLDKLDRISGLLEGVRTGKLTPAATEVAALAESFGIKIDPKLGQKQAAEALANEMALQLRNPAGGAGMPGALSDKDREFLTKMTPGLAKTPEGNKLIIETARKLAKRDIEVAKLAREYRQKHKTLDDGFHDELKAFADARPLFSSSVVPSTTSNLTPAEQEELRALRERFSGAGKK